MPGHFTLSAHAAFFVDDATTPRFSSLLEPGPLLAIACGTLAGLLVWCIASACADPRRDRCLVRWMSETVSGTLVALTEFVPVIARIALASTLIWCAAVGSLLTPNLAVHGHGGVILQAAAVALGLLLIVNRATRMSALGAVALLAAAAVLAGSPIVVLERLDIVGLAGFVAIVGGRRLEPRLDAATVRTIGVASTVLRVSVALGLLVVAITEKLANIPMTAQVLAQHPRVNVGLLLGLDLESTVLLLGAAEVAFAVLVLLLPLPELLALAIGAPFVLSVGEFGVLEVPGHLPVWGAVSVLALLGAHPQTADLLSVRPPWMRSMRRTPDAARSRVVGASVPWVTAEPAPEHDRVSAPTRILVGGTHTLPRAPQVPREVPRAPQVELAPQVAAWLANPAPPAAAVPSPAPATTRSVQPDSLARFEWAARPGAGVPAR